MGFITQEHLAMLLPGIQWGRSLFRQQILDIFKNTGSFNNYRIVSQSSTPTSPTFPVYVTDAYF